MYTHASFIGLVKIKLFNFARVRLYIIELGNIDFKTFQ